jgi:hypothetical protein
VINCFSKLALLHHRPNENGCNLVSACIVVFIPRYDQQTVMGLCELNVAINVLLQPRIGLRDGAVVHVIIEVWINDGNRGQVCKVCRKTCERPI